MRIKTSIYFSADTPVHRCNVTVKILSLLVFSVSIFFVDSLAGMAFCALAVLILIVMAKIPLKDVVLPSVPVAVLSAFALACNVFYASSPEEGLAVGAIVALRMIVLVVASFLVCFTTTSDELVGSFASMMYPLRRFRVPVDDISLTLSMALRFIPLVAEEFSYVHDAQAVRGAHFGTGSVFDRMKAWGGIFVPLFVGLFRRADKVAIAMDFRCYGAPGVLPGVNRRTRLHETKVALRDRVTLALVLVACAVLTAL